MPIVDVARLGRVDELARIKTALERMVNIHLQWLIDATRKTPPATPGLLGWINSACEWELSRRAGKGYELQPPAIVIPPDECAYSIQGAILLRSAFANESLSVHAFFDELVALLTGEGRRQ